MGTGLFGSFKGLFGNFKGFFQVTLGGFIILLLGCFIKPGTGIFFLLKEFF